jgi:DNA-binding transcriptional ArsR family regulator
LTVFDALISSRTRVRILMRLFLDAGHQAHLRQLAREFSVSPSQIRDELRQLSAAGLLRSRQKGRQLLYSADPSHPMFPELRSMVHKALGMDRILESIVERLGNLERAFLVDDYAQGRDTGLIDLVLIGEIDRTNLADLVRKTERYIERKIRTLVLSADEFVTLRATLDSRPQLILWSRESQRSAEPRRAILCSPESEKEAHTTRRRDQSRTPEILERTAET